MLQILNFRMLRAFWENFGENFRRERLKIVHSRSRKTRMKPSKTGKPLPKSQLDFESSSLRPLRYVSICRCRRPKALQPHYYNKNPLWRQLPERRLVKFFCYWPASRMDSTAFWTWRRFSASVKISSAWSSKTALEISSPRWAGRQWRTMWSGLAPCSRRLVSW